MCKDRCGRVYVCGGKGESKCGRVVSDVSFKCGCRKSGVGICVAGVGLDVGVCVPGV